MRFIAILAGLTVSIAALPDAARACSPVPDYRPPTPAEQARSTRDGFHRASAVVEVIAETGSTYSRPGRMRVLRVFKGNLRPGAMLTVSSIPGSMCGPGDFSAGARGVMMIHGRGAITFPGFISPAHVAMLRRERLLPPR